MKILLLSKYSRAGASSRLRSLQYLSKLESAGFDVTVSNLFDNDYLSGLYGQGRRSRLLIIKLYLKRFADLVRLYRYDLLWIEKEVFPYFPAIIERLLSRFGKPYIVDYDDAIFHNYDLSKNPILNKVLGRKIDVVMRNSSCVVAGNAYLASRAQAAGARCVKIVPTVVDHARYIPRCDSIAGRPIIGWIGSPTTEKYVVGIRETLVEVCKTHNASLLLVGATQDVVDQFPGIEVEVVPWSENTESELIGRMDIGIMPLVDGPWEKGKCGYKLIQYMACAVPVIASPVGVNVEIVSSTHSGYLADTSAEWGSALDSLLASPERRKDMGGAGRIAVENQYCLEVQAPQLVRFFADALTQRRG